MAKEPEEWTWRDYVVLLVAVVWATSYLAGLFVKDYKVPMEINFAMLGVMTALGLVPREK